MDRARAGDADAMEAVLAAVAPTVERFARRMCPGAEADDATQEALLALATNLSRFEGRAALSSWAFALTRSACARQRRGLKNQPHAGEEAFATVPDDAPDPERRVTDDELARALDAALARLSREHREVIVLRDIDGLTAPEAARSLGLSVEALKSRLHRARGALRDALRPLLEPAEPAPESSPRCRELMDLWTRRLEGDLSPEDCAAMERHLEGCPRCGAACEALKRALWVCQRSGAGAGALTPEARSCVRRAMDAWRSGPSR